MARQLQRTPHERVDDVRRAVLDSALDIIAHEGANAVSMREVARRAGVSHQAPYHYFVDRAGIFAAIAEEGFTQFTAVFREVLDTSSDPLLGCLQAYVHFATTHIGHYRVMFQSDICGIETHPPTQAAADKAFLALLDLAEVISSPTDAQPNSMLLPITLWSHAHGLATLLIDGPLLKKLPEGTQPDDLIQQVAQFFSRSIRAEINN